MFLGGSWRFFVVLGNFLVVLGGAWGSVLLSGSWWFLLVLGGS